jgi:beta-lactamase regulating signal transducer with metallopeptidase domain
VINHGEAAMMAVYNLLSINLHSINAHLIPVHSIAQVAGLRIVDCLLEGTLIAIFAGLIVKLARRQSSGTRFAVWFSALMTIAALPVVGGADWLHRGGFPGSVSRPLVTLPGSWAVYMFGAWALIAAWAVMGVAAGLRHLRVLRKSCVPLDLSQLDARLRETLKHNATARRVELCVSDKVHVPTAIGLVKPAVVVPTWVMQDLSPDELNHVLLHELAHLRRWDDWTNLAQKVVKALFFFHPAVWWIEKKVSLEREMACDDAVLAATARPRAYAECLARLAERTLIRRSVALAQAAVGRIRHLSLRVAQILDANRSTTTGKNWTAVALVAGFAIACAVSVSRAPKLVAFQDSGARASRPAISASASTVGMDPVSSLTIANARPLNTVMQNRSVRAVPAHAVQAQAIQAHLLQTMDQRASGSTRNSHSARAHVAIAAERDSRLAVGNIVHLTKSVATPVAFTETIYVVVEDPADGSASQPMFSIRVWRVMVLRPAADPVSSRIPRKET